jgi:HEAT repeat protein
MGPIATPSELDQLLFQLERAPDRTARSEAAHACGDLRTGAAPVLQPLIDRQVIPALIRMARSPATPRPLRGDVILALGRLGGPAAAAALIRLLGRPGLDGAPLPELTSAVIALGPSATPGVARLLRDAVPSVLLADDLEWTLVLLDILEGIGDSTAVAALADLLRVRDERLQSRVVATLRGIGSPDAAAVLVRALESANAGLRIDLAAALRTLRPEGALPVLAGYLRAGDASLRELARELAAAIQVSSPPLQARLRFLDHEDSERLAAADARLIPHLVFLVTHGAVELQARAADWLGAIALADPQPGLRAALDPIRARLRPWAATPAWAAELLRRALERIEAATRDFGNLPLSAQAPPPDPAALPRAAEPAVGDPAALPRSSRAPE